MTTANVHSFSCADEFLPYFEARAQALAMEVRPAHLAQCEPAWKVVGKILNGLFDGVSVQSFMASEIKRPDGRFFRIAGIDVVRAAGREVSGWFQPMIFDDGDGFVALVHDLSTDDVLVRIKAEPGNVGLEICGANTRVLVSPSLQFSRGNLLHNEAALRGELDEKGQRINPIPLAGLVSDGRYFTLDSDEWELAPEDGGRFFEKVNRYGLVDIWAKQDVEEDLMELGASAEDFLWVSIDLLRRIRRAGLANGHLRSAMSLLA